jgi:NAD(P)-binding Rossmann-like domain
MTAGTGIRHSEKNDRSAVNPGAGRPLDLIQMWVVPDVPEVTPGYEQLELDPSDLQDRLVVVASGMARHRDQAAIRIRNRYAALHVARLEPGDSVTIPDAPFAHVYLARGRMDLEAEGALDAWRRCSPYRGRRAPPHCGRAERGPDLGDACLPEPGNPLSPVRRTVVTQPRAQYLDGPVAIIGAGIGGLTAALSLQHSGVPVRVFEQDGDADIDHDLTVQVNDF